MNKVILEGSNICKEFSGSGINNLILNHVNVKIFDQDFTVIMGASGAGKSTLLYSLCGMDSITSGVVTYKERNISSFSEKQMAELRANEFGFVFQQTHLVSNLTLFENVAVAGYVSSKLTIKQAWEKALALLSQMNVADAMNRLPAQVSGGEAQRAALARAMIGSPGIIFADEPTGALNKSSSEEVLNLLTEMNGSEQSILMVTHDVRAAIRGTRILYLEDGKILDELSLPVYSRNDARAREEKVTQWLTSLQW